MKLQTISIDHFGIWLLLAGRKKLLRSARRHHLVGKTEFVPLFKYFRFLPSVSELEVGAL